MLQAILKGVPALLLLFGSVSCNGTGFTSFLNFGGGDRKDVLVERVHVSRELHIETREKLNAAMEAFALMTKTSESAELEEIYKRFQDDTEDFSSLSKRLAKAIVTLERDSTSLFAEWRTELDEYSSQTLRQKSEQMLVETQDSFNTLLASYRSCQKSMEPVQASLSDYDLFLDQNLNPRAIASLGDTLDDLRKRVGRLRSKLNEAVQASDQFLDLTEGEASQREEAPLK